MKKHEHVYGPTVANTDDDVEYEACVECGSRVAKTVPTESRCRICGKKEQ
jgi:hypothetical protein